MRIKWSSDFSARDTREGLLSLFYQIFKKLYCRDSMRSKRYLFGPSWTFWLAGNWGTKLQCVALSDVVFFRAAAANVCCSVHFFLHCYFFFRLELGFFSLFLLIQLHLLPSSSLTPFSWIITVYSMFLAYSNNLKKNTAQPLGNCKKIFLVSCDWIRLYRMNIVWTILHFNRFHILFFHCVHFILRPFLFFLLFFCCVSLKWRLCGSSSWKQKKSNYVL